jgi:Tfp pilus assembly protein PilN
MEPKFQSSFIPRGPAVSNVSMGGAPVARRRQRDIFSVLASALFTISLFFAAGVFGYKYFLNYQIKTMGQELEAARAALEPETVNELIRLDSRLSSTKSLIANHRIISPVFQFLAASTPATVRYSDFNFNMTAKGLELTLNGEARSYASLASASDLMAQSPYFRNPVFSDLSLDDQGNVQFIVTTQVDPSLLSYQRLVDSTRGNEVPVQNIAPVSTSTPRTGTSTAATSTPAR